MKQATLKQNYQESLPFRGTAHLILDFQPWHMAFKVEGIEIGTEIFLCRIKRQSVPRDFTIEELLGFLRSRYSITIQLHSKSDDIPMVLPHCMLETADIDPSGLLINLRITSKIAEVEEMMQNLAYAEP